MSPEFYSRKLGIFFTALDEANQTVPSDIYQTFDPKLFNLFVMFFCFFLCYPHVQDGCQAVVMATHIFLKS